MRRLFLILFFLQLIIDTIKDDEYLIPNYFLIFIPSLQNNEPLDFSNQFIEPFVAREGLVNSLGFLQL